MVRAVLCKDYGGPQALVMGDLSIAAPREHEVRVAVHAAGVGFSDILISQGTYQTKPPTPFAPGSESAGVVIDVGRQVTRFKPGDRVTARCSFGAFAEEVVVPEHRATRMPDGVSFEQGAALLAAYGTSYYALKHRANLQPGEVLAVHGASGGLGLAAVALGKQMGATVIGTVGGADKADVVREHGADHIVDYRSSTRLRDQIKALTGDKGANVIYDPVGGDLFDESLRCIDVDGRLLVVGFASGRIPSAPANLVLLKNIDIVGVHYGPWTDREQEASRELSETLLAWCAAGRIRPQVTTVQPLEEAAQVLQGLANRTLTGKVVLKVR